MMDTAQPSFEVREYEMNNGHELFGNLRIAPFGDGRMVIAMFGESSVAAPIISDDSGTRRHDALDEATECIGTPVRYHCKPDTSGIATVPAVIERTVAFAVPYFNSSGHNSLVVHASPFSASSSAQIGFVDLDMLARLRPNLVLVRPHHANAQLVKDLEGGLVARQSELPLELHGRHAWRLAGNQVRRPEPYRERRVRALHDCASSKTGVAAAMAASENAATIGKAIRLISHPAVTARESVAPSGSFKIGSASHLIRKEALEFRQRARERQIIPHKHIDGHSCSCLMQMFNILPVVGMGDNRISTVLSNQVSLYCIPIDSLFCIPMNQGCEGRNIRHNNTYLDVDLEPLPPRHSKLNIYAEPLEIFGGLISCIPEPLHEPLIKEHNGNIVFRVKDCDIISLYPRSNETHWPFDLKLAQEQQAEWVRRLDEVGVIAKQNGSMMKMSITLKQLQEHPDLLKKLLYACLDNAGVDFQALEDICLF